MSLSGLGYRRPARRQRRRSAESGTAACGTHALDVDWPQSESEEEPMMETLAHAADGSCAVCQCDWEAGARVHVLPCEHRFHPECVSMWLARYKAECPLCRACVAESACGPAPRAPRTLGLFMQHDARVVSAGGRGRAVRSARSRRRGGGLC